MFHVDFTVSDTTKQAFFHFFRAPAEGNQLSRYIFNYLERSNLSCCLDEYLSITWLLVFRCRKCTKFLLIQKLLSTRLYRRVLVKTYLRLDDGHHHLSKVQGSSLNADGVSFL